MVHLAKLNAERHGVRVEVAKNGKDLLARAEDERPDLIVLGNDLRAPTTEELVQLLHRDPRLRGVQVVVVKGLLPDWTLLKKAFPWPGP